MKQAVTDIAVIRSGSVEAAMEIAAENGMAVTDDVTEIITSASPLAQSVADYFSTQSIQPATAVTDGEEVELLQLPAPEESNSQWQPNRYAASSMQSVADVAIMATGAMETAMEIAAKNGLSVTDDLTGTTMETVEVDNNKVVVALGLFEISVATAITEAENEALLPQGIGWWIIGSTFIVSNSD